MIIIHAYMKIDPKQRGAFLEMSQQVISHSKAEEENISYHLYEDTDQDNRFVFLEVWKSEDSIQKHEATTHFKMFVKELPRFLLEPISVEKYRATEKM